MPTVTLNTTPVPFVLLRALVSTRVSNYRYNPVWGALIEQLWVH